MELHTVPIKPKTDLVLVLVSLSIGVKPLMQSDGYESVPAASHTAIGHVDKRAVQRAEEGDDVVVDPAAPDHHVPDHVEIGRRVEDPEILRVTDGVERNGAVDRARSHLVPSLVDEARVALWRVEGDAREDPGVEHDTGDQELLLSHLRHSYSVGESAVGMTLGEIGEDGEDGGGNQDVAVHVAVILRAVELLHGFQNFAQERHTRPVASMNEQKRRVEQIHRNHVNAMLQAVGLDCLRCSKADTMRVEMLGEKPHGLNCVPAFVIQLQ